MNNLNTGSVTCDNTGSSSCSPCEQGAQGDPLTSTNENEFIIKVQYIGGGYQYNIDGVLIKELTIYREDIYIFNQNSASNLNHPLRFSETENGIHATNGVEYKNGVTYTGTPGYNGQIIFIVPQDAPSTLYYYCTYHTGMGAKINIIDKPV